MRVRIFEINSRAISFFCNSLNRLLLSATNSRTFNNKRKRERKKERLFSMVRAICLEIHLSSNRQRQVHLNFFE